MIFSNIFYQPYTIISILMYYVPICGSHIRKIKDLRHGHVNSPWDLIQVVKLPSCSLRMKRWFLCLYVAPCSNQFTPVKDVLSPFLWHLEVNSSWQIVVQDCHINSFGLFFLSFFLLLSFFYCRGCSISVCGPMTWQQHIIYITPIIINPTIRYYLLLFKKHKLKSA